jgi:nitrite reductase/ring-hydroxylating ferredoxin subunit
VTERLRAGTIDALQEKGCLTAKIGAQPVCVFWSDGQAYAVDDRCPHMGFPLHRGSVDNGLLTCHWHHARFDLTSGGTLDPFADDVRAYPVELEGADVVVVVDAPTDQVGHFLRRLDDGLEHGLSLVMAKAVLALMDTLGPDKAITAIIAAGTDFGLRYRDEGWGSGLTVLTAMANVSGVLDPRDRALALVHGLTFVSRDTMGHPPRFALEPLTAPLPADRLNAWYRRFVDTRSGDAAERSLVTAVRAGLDDGEMAAIMGAAATDHVFISGGHVIDFTNKAFEVLDQLGWERAGDVLAALAQQTAFASRSEETGAWRHPDDLAGLLVAAEAELTARMGAVVTRTFDGDEDVDALAWAVLADDPTEIVASLDRAVDRGATGEELARAVAYAAALRVTRFHTQNDHGDWDVIHHGFTSANAVHQLIGRAPTPELIRGVYQGALKIYLDRFLNVPSARLPGQHPAAAGNRSLDELQGCWDAQGMVDDAGAIVYGWLRAGGTRTSVLAALGSALLSEDAEFHWFQTFEAAVRQSAAWPEGSEQVALILAGTARFLAAHTPTRRELPQVVRIATRLRRGEPLFEAD